MMSTLRFRLLYLVLLPAIAIAAGILGYYSWRAASRFAQLGEETIVESTLLIVNEKVDRVEQDIITADNAVFGLVDLDEPREIERAWPAVAAEISPTIKAVLILDDAGNVLGYAMRGGPSDRREFLKVFLERIMPDLELERQRVGRLKHLHQTYSGSSYLVSYKAFRHGGRRYYAAGLHDTGKMVRETFPSLFVTEEGKRLYNVVDENNRRVYGPSLARAGDYLVGRRFPTTLYNWRLQVAPKQAPLLDAQAKSRRQTEVSLVVTALLILLLGVGFVLWAADKERRVNALKAEFVANVSHELKTPLSVVRMFAEMLLTKRVRSEEKRQQYLELICRESERLSALVENVLDFAALERGMRSYALRPGDVVEVVSRAIDTFRMRLERDGSEVSLDVVGDIPHVALDDQSVLLAVMNLLDNAVKYGEGTAVEAIVEALPKSVTVRVRDHGPGIPREDLKRVFERFYRTRRRDREIRGSGIGLSLVKHIAEAHGGRAWAENADGGGAIVGFSLPLPKRATETSRSRERHVVTEKPAS